MSAMTAFYQEAIALRLQQVARHGLVSEAQRNALRFLTRETYGPTATALGFDLEELVAEDHEAALEESREVGNDV